MTLVDPTVATTAALVDGVAMEIPDVAAATPLAEVLRAGGHTSVKIGCAEGGCGACVVQVDGTPMPSCVVPAARVRGREVRTATALTTEPAGALIAEEFARRNALQCGYCIPGMVATTSVAVAGAQADAEEADNQPPPGSPTQGALDAAYQQPRALDGHLCRCTGYQGLRAALDRAATGTPSGIPARLDGHERATGQTRFTADHAPPGTLTGLLLTCRTPHARVTVEPGTAMDVPGAVAVLGPQDSPSRRFSTNPHLEDPVLSPAEEDVFASEGRWVGDVVGMVVATSPAAAREMAARVAQTEEPLPAVLDLDAALAEGAPVFELTVGAPAEDLDAALTVAAEVVTETFHITPGPQAPMERPGALAEWAEGRLRIWSTSQTPQVVRTRVAGLFGLDLDVVDLEPVPLGGGFGLKEEVFLEPAAVVAASVTGRPVLVETTRAQLGALRRRHGARIEVTTGCAADGTMTARAVHVVLDAGGSVGHSALVLENALLVAAQLYPAPVVRVTGASYRTHTTTSSAYRGYGAAEVVHAIESHVEDLARRAGEDPVAYRRRHVLAAGGPDLMNGWTVSSFAGREALDALAPHRRHRLPEDPSGRWVRGRGIATFALVSAASSAVHHDSAEATVRVDADGSVVVGTVVPDMGSGLHTTLTGVVAERLRVPQTRIRVEQLPSAHGPADEGTFATRGVYVTANAVADAADNLRAALVRAAADAIAAERAGFDESEVTLTPLGVVAAGRTLPLASLAGVSATGRAVAPDNGLIAGTTMADVAVDTHTGRVVVERVVSVHDVGRVLDPDLARGQVVGGVVQGVGMALTERLRHVAGEPLDVHLLDQAVPTAHTAPEIADIYVGDGHARGLLRAKGLGEAPLVGVPAAVANAVRDATGVRIRSLPLDPETVLDALTRR